MKLLKNEFVILIVLLALIAAVGSAVLLYPSPAKIEKQTQENQGEKNQENISPEAIEKELASQRILDDNLYSIIIPEGWVQAVIGSDKFLALVIKPDGLINPADLADVDYDTYYAVNNTKTEANSLDEYVDLLKQNLVKQIPSIEFTKQSYGTINGHDAIYLETVSVMDGNNYRTLLTFVADAKWVWAISFNTLANSWEENKSIFYEVSDSFVIK